MESKRTPRNFAEGEAEMVVPLREIEMSERTRFLFVKITSWVFSGATERPSERR